MVALRVLDLEFRGKAAHAAASPDAGLNALDALMLGWSAMSALRQLVRSDSRIHGIITDGGQASNVIPERAAARIVVRAGDPSYLGDLRRRVLACRGAQRLATRLRAALRMGRGDGHGHLERADGRGVRRQRAPLGRSPRSTAGRRDLRLNGHGQHQLGHSVDPSVPLRERRPGALALARVRPRRAGCRGRSKRCTLPRRRSRSRRSTCSRVLIC